MRRITILFITVLFVLSLTAVFAGGAKEEPEEESAAMGEEQSAVLEPGGEDHTELYNLSDWEDETGKTMSFNESPVLAEKVKNGDLPPVEERLPKDPQVIKPSEMIGSYGGTWRRAILGKLPLLVYTEKREPLLTRDYLLNRIVPNIVKGFSFNDNNTVFTFHLREGLKWSDGHPFTSEDITFYWNHMNLNEELNPVPDHRLGRDGNIGTCEAIDDYTVQITFSAPYGSFPEILSNSYHPIIHVPAHYLKQFHPDFTDEETLNARVEEAGFKTWTELISAVDNMKSPNPDRPVLGAWYPIDRQGAPILRFRRNPYYFKVDTEGNQLPYIDNVEESIVGDGEAVLLKAIAGDIDIQGLRLGGVTKRPTLIENANQGEYVVVNYPGPENNLSTLFFNFFHEDEVLADLFKDKDFRVALSHAIDRQEISDLSYKGVAPVSQVSPSSITRWFNEEYAKAYTNHNLDVANRMLDELGLEWDSNKEYRMRPDGKRLRLAISALTTYPPENVENCELIAGYWADIGIDVVVKPTDRGLFETQIESSDFDIAAWNANFGYPGSPPSQSSALFPTGTASRWGVQWAQWLNTGGDAGVEPPQQVKRLREIYEQLPAMSDLDAKDRLYTEAMKIHHDNLWMLGIVREPAEGRQFVFKRNVGNKTEYGYGSFRNADKKFPWAWAQYFFK